eukprot:642471-Prymnesium_polylepis.2
MPACGRRRGDASLPWRLEKRAARTNPHEAPLDRLAEEGLDQPLLEHLALQPDALELLNRRVHARAGRRGRCAVVVRITILGLHCARALVPDGLALTAREPEVAVLYVAAVFLLLLLLFLLALLLLLLFVLVLALVVLVLVLVVDEFTSRLPLAKLALATERCHLLAPLGGRAAAARRRRALLARRYRVRRCGPPRCVRIVGRLCLRTAPALVLVRLEAVRVALALDDHISLPVRAGRHPSECQVLGPARR